MIILALIMKILLALMRKDSIFIKFFLRLISRIDRILKGWYDLHSFKFWSEYFPKFACKYNYLISQPFFVLKKCFCIKSSSLVTKKYIGDSFKHLYIMNQIFIFLKDLYLLYARLPILHITNIGTPKK